MTRELDTDGIFRFEPDPDDDPNEQLPPDLQRMVEMMKPIVRELMSDIFPSPSPRGLGWTPPVKPELEYMAAKLTNDLPTIITLTELFNDGWRIGEPPIIHDDFTILILCREKENNANNIS